MKILIECDEYLQRKSIFVNVNGKMTDNEKEMENRMMVCTPKGRMSH